MATPSSSPHKPRRRSKKPSAAAAGPSSAPSSSSSPVKLKSRPQLEVVVRAPSFPLAAFLWPARKSSSQWEILPLILIAVGLFRWAAGLWGYSGFNRPPLHGDYEAQRHWMELTANLPISQWYFHDLEWWGLDYPPLTAYHSWIMGKIGSLINPDWFALFSSRGLEDPDLKIFMRATVIVSEYFTYIPAAVVFVRRFSRISGVSNWTSSIALVAILMQPSTILIDHIHFQYNTVMLGLVLASMSSLLAERYMWSAVFFVAALGFKQMALYYAFTIFAYLLGRCFFPLRLGRLVMLTLVTVVSFAILVLPLVAGSFYDAYRGIDARPDLDKPVPLPIFAGLSDYLDTDAMYYPVVQQLVQVVHRVFPFARGLFEDKVANFWCALNVVVKIKHYPPELLQKGAALATLLAIIPPNLILFFRPRKTTMPLAFAATAWGFFLFSWQVHEKSVLLPLMPMTLLLAGRQGMNREIRVWVGFANILGAWTMFPLLSRVDLRVPYAVLTLLWAYLLGLPPTSWGVYFDGTDATGAPTKVTLSQVATALLHTLFYLAMGAWHVVQAFVPPPVTKPDLWTVANVGVGVTGFTLCYLWCLWRLVVESDILPARSTGKKAQ